MRPRRWVLAAVLCTLGASACSGPAPGLSANHQALDRLDTPRLQVQAYELGAWFALADACLDDGGDRSDCYRHAAETVESEVGSDPRNIDWSRELGMAGSLVGQVDAGYAITWNGLRPGELDGAPPLSTERVFADRPAPWTRSSS